MARPTPRHLLRSLGGHGEEGVRPSRPGIRVGPRPQRGVPVLRLDRLQAGSHRRQAHGVAVHATQGGFLVVARQQGALRRAPKRRPHRAERAADSRAGSRQLWPRKPMAPGIGWLTWTPSWCPRISSRHSIATRKPDSTGMASRLQLAGGSSSGSSTPSDRRLARSASPRPWTRRLAMREPFNGSRALTDLRR